MLVRGPLYSTSPPKIQPKPYRRRGRRMRHGVCAAALHAVTAARLYLSGAILDLLKASESCGSNPTYVSAAIVVLRSENAGLLEHVPRGHIPLLAAANQVRRLVDLVRAYRASDQNDHITCFRTAGPDHVFEEVVQAAAG